MLEFFAPQHRPPQNITIVPLSSPRPRHHVHTRRIEFESYQREDGRWDIEAHLTDVKPYDCPLESGLLAAGEPMHEMWIRLVIDDDLNIVEAEAAIDAMPYPGECARIAPDYRKLIGLNLLRNFRQRAVELFGGIQGCTHLTELLANFPTAAVQSMFKKPREEEAKPFQLDRCHALQTSGEAVRRYYPKWFRPQGRP